MRTMHGIFDVNNDGVISFDDFIILADKFGDLGHLSPEEMEEFRDVMKVINYGGKNHLLWNEFIIESLSDYEEVRKILKGVKNVICYEDSEIFKTLGWWITDYLEEKSVFCWKLLSLGGFGKVLNEWKKF